MSKLIWKEWYKANHRSWKIKSTKGGILACVWYMQDSCIYRTYVHSLQDPETFVQLEDAQWYVQDQLKELQVEITSMGEKSPMLAIGRLKALRETCIKSAEEHKRTQLLIIGNRIKDSLNYRVGYEMGLCEVVGYIKDLITELKERDNNNVTTD